VDDYLATVHVKLREPIYDVDDPQGTAAQGYYRVFGVRGTPQQIELILAREIDDGVIEWPDSEWHPINPESLEMEIRKRTKPVADEGIWYRSGRVLYADPGLEHQPS
jgi:hypothetical protein